VIIHWSSRSHKSVQATFQSSTSINSSTFFDAILKVFVQGVFTATQSQKVSIFFNVVIFHSSKDFFIEAEFSDSTQIIFVSGESSLKTVDSHEINPVDVYELLVSDATGIMMFEKRKISDAEDLENYLFKSSNG